MDLFKGESSLIIWTIISFGVLLLLLSKFALRPLLDVMDKREKRIRESLETAEHARLEAERLLKEHEEHLAKAREESQEIIAQGKKLGEGMKQEIVDKAREQADSMIEKAQIAINKQRDEALDELQKKVAGLSIEIASKIIERSLNSKDHQKLIEDYLSKVGEGSIES